nr:hypothetical protein [Elizabethkingia miricola]
MLQHLLFLWSYWAALTNIRKISGERDRNTWVQVYLYAILIVLAFAFVSGIIPALYLSGFKPIQTLKGNFSGSKHGICFVMQYYHYSSSSPHFYYFIIDYL